MAALFLPSGAAGGTASRSAVDAWIVFSRGAWEGSAIWTVDSNGTGLVQLTHPPKGSADKYPAWSPDRARIAFFRFVRVGEDFRGDAVYRSDLMLVNADGSALRRLATSAWGGNGEHGPAWSSNGGRIAFLRRAWIWTVNTDGSNTRRLVRGVDIDHPVWSPSGHEIAFDQWTGKRTEMFVVSTSRTGLRKLAPTFGGETYWQVDWSPSGRQVAFLGSPVEGGDVSLYVVNRNGGGLRKVVGGASSKDLNTPEWSPDGSTLLIERGGSGIGGRRDSAFAVSSASGRLRRVATDTDFAEWSPDGQSVAFVKRGNLHVVSATGGRSRRIALDARAPDW